MFSVDAGRVEGGIETPVCSNRSGDRARDRLVVTDVAAKKPAVASRLQVGCCGLTRLLVPVCQHDPPTAADEFAGSGKPDP